MHNIKLLIKIKDLARDFPKKMTFSFLFSKFLHVIYLWQNHLIQLLIAFTN